MDRIVYGEKLIDANWNVDDIIRFITANGANVEQDNDGQIILYTDLYQHNDGSLWSERKE